MQREHQIVVNLEKTELEGHLKDLDFELQTADVDDDRNLSSLTKHD